MTKKRKREILAQLYSKPITVYERYCCTEPDTIRVTTLYELRHHDVVKELAEFALHEGDGDFLADGSFMEKNYYCSEHQDDDRARGVTTVELAVADAADEK